MLEEIHVSDLALIEEAWLEFDHGLTVLSGETGAGKTVLVGALKLLMGERADSSAVRTGASEAVIEGRFSQGGDDFVVKRRVGADGRSRCSIDSEMATVANLASKAGPLVDLHGQHDHQALLSSVTHAGYLDRWAGDAAAAALDAYRGALAAYREALRERDQLDARIAEAARNADQLRFMLREIEAVDPEPGEDDEIIARLPALQHAERLAEAAGLAAGALRGEGGAADVIARAAGALARVEGIDPALDELAARIREVQVLADDAGTAARAYRDAVEHDSAALEDLQARGAAISGLVKKYGPTLGEVLAKAASARDSLAAAERSDEAKAAADERVSIAEKGLRSTGSLLSELRRGAAPGFCEALKAACADLAMAGASFEVSFEDLGFDGWTPEGPHRLEFLYAAAEGQNPRPLSKIASGGEISRVMLAMKGVLGTADTVETLVFDEIDAGIGGATAQAVGRRLAALAESHQVIVVTHLAQVAVHASCHLVVSRADSGASSTKVRRVVGDDRVAEVARMLSGNDSGASVEHAKELLASAGASL